MSRRDKFNWFNLDHVRALADRMGPNLVVLEKPGHRGFMIAVHDHPKTWDKRFKLHHATTTEAHQ